MVRARTFGWTVLVVVLAAASTATIDATTAPPAAADPIVTPTIDPTDRASVLAAYQGSLVAARNVAVGWTGNAATCTKGTESAASIQATRAAVNFYRGLNRLPPVTMDATYSSKALAAALMMEANGTLDHDPPTSWACYTADGDQGAGSSNLAQGATAARAIDGYMEEPGAGNYFAGHRRWILSPTATTFGTGSTTRYNALWIFGPTGQRPSGATWVAWPNAGYVPKSLVKPVFSLSSNVHPTANYAGASISVKVGDTSLAVTKHPIQDGYGDNTLTWQVALPAGFSSSDADVRFDITVSGIKTAAGATLPAVSYSSTAIVNAEPPPPPPYAPFGSWGAMVDRIFVDLTATAPTPAERSSWVSQLSNRTKVPGDLVEALRRGPDNTSKVDPGTRLYSAFLGRTPDASGLKFWTSRRRAGTWTLNKMAEQFARSTEFQRRYGTLTNRAYVTLIYTDVLGRAADPSGVDYWTRQLDTGRRTRGTVMVGFSESSEYKAKQVHHVDVAVAMIFLLDRAPTTDEVSAWVAARQGGTPAPDLAGELLASTEYADHITG